MLRYLTIISIMLLSFFLALVIFDRDAGEKEGRLLIQVTPGAHFSPEELAEVLSLTLIHVNERNPFKTFPKDFLNKPLVVITPSISPKLFSKLAKSYGYRRVTISEGSLEAAIEKISAILKNIPKTSADLERVNSDDARNLYDLLTKVDRIFTKEKIAYFATAGTLLGAVRHKGIIPWDDDIDLAILDHDEKKVLALKEELEKEGLELYSDPKGFYKISDKKGACIPDIKKPGTDCPYHFPFIDVFVMTLEHQKEHRDVYVHQSAPFYLAFPNEKFRYEQIEYLRRVPFGPITIPVPGNAEEFLTKNFGTSYYPALWKTYALERTWSHKEEKPVNIEGAALVEIDDYAPLGY